MVSLGALTPFHNPRFSLYFTGQVVSNTGTWFQNLALSLVILGATGSAQALSGVTIAQFLPLLVLGIPAGRLADRSDGEFWGLFLHPAQVQTLH